MVNTMLFLPQELSLEMLAKVAVIADDYEYKRALYLMVDIWIKNPKIKNNPQCSRDLILWLWIAWFFELRSQFKESTFLAIANNEGLFDSFGLPFPNSVIVRSSPCLEMIHC
jgi:hypothetical protein